MYENFSPPTTRNIDFLKTLKTYSKIKQMFYGSD